MDPTSITSLIGAPVNALTLVIVVGLIVIQLADKGLLRIGKQSPKEKVPEWAKRLDAYFNHDTTNHHIETQHLLKEVISLQGKTHEGLGEIRDYIRDSSKVLERIDRDGVRCKVP